MSSTTSSQSSKKKPLRIVLISVVSLACLAAAGIATVAFGGLSLFRPSTTHPPCDQLPSTAQAQEALAYNMELAEGLEDTSNDVQVGVGSPCGEGKNQSLIEVTYTDDASLARIETALNRSDGFGVPVYVHRR